MTLGYDTHGLERFIANPADPELLLDGLYFDTGYTNDVANTGISVLGDIGVGAAALVVAVEGDLSGKAYLTLNPDLLNKPGSDSDPSQNKLYVGGVLDAQSVDKLFGVSGDVSVSLNVEGGAFFGPLDIAVFTVQLASDELINFSTAIYPGNSGGTLSSDPHTIYIDLKDGDQNINVYTTQKITSQIERPETADGGYGPRTEDIESTEYTLVVDYGDHQDTYPLGYVDDDVIKHTSTYLFHPGDTPGASAPPDYDLIAVRPSSDGSEYSGNHTITIEPSAIGGILVSADNVTPIGSTAQINAVLVGGSGNDTFIYQASGQAVLVGNGGSNELEGGDLEFGNYVNLRPTGGAVAGTIPAGWNVPQPVMDELRESEATNAVNFQVYESLGFPVPDVGSNNLVGTPGSDVLIGGPGGNTFQGDGGDDSEYGGAGFDTYVVSGNKNVFSHVRIYSSVQAYQPIYALSRGIYVENRQARYNGDELDVVSEPPAQSFVPPPPSNTNPVTIEPLGNSLPNDNTAFPGQAPVEVTTPEVTIDASGLSKVDLGGVDEATFNLDTPQGPTYESPYQVTSLSIGNLSGTTLDTIELSPVPNGPPCPIVFSGTFRGGDRFEEESGAVPAKTVTVRTVPNASTTIAGHESTTVELTPAGYVAPGPIIVAPPAIHPVTLSIDNIRPQDSVTLDGGGGRDTYIVNLDISASFSTSIQDSSERGLDTLEINGSGFVHPIPSRQNNEVNFDNGGYIPPPQKPQNTVALPAQYANLGGPVEGFQPVSAIAGQTSASVFLAGSDLGPVPVSFSSSVGIAPKFQDSVTYVSPNDVEFENDVRESGSVVEQSTVHVRFNDNVKFLNVNGTPVGNTFDVTGLSALVTIIQGGPQGDVYNVGADSGANRPVAAINLVVSNAIRDTVLRVVGAALRAGGNKTAIKRAAISTVDKHVGTAFNLGRNSAVLGSINLSVRTALKLGAKRDPRFAQRQPRRISQIDLCRPGLRLQSL